MTMQTLDDTRLDITSAPYNADPTGQRDSTQAFKRAFDEITNVTRQAFHQTLKEIEALPGDTARHPDGFENRKVDGRIIGIFPARRPFVPTLYIPAGTYLVSDTLTYSFTDLQNSFGSELSWQIRIKGDGMGKTIIQLADNSEGFDQEEPKPIIQYMHGRGSNVNMSNYCQALTIHTGKGNPSAIGVDFFANNSGAVRDVEVISGDGAGFAGVRLGHANYSGILLNRIIVSGLDYGIHADSRCSTMFFHGEGITVSDQNKAGVYTGAISASFRNLTTKNVPIGVHCNHQHGHTVVVDSQLSGNGAAAIERSAGTLYADNVTIDGFDGSTSDDPTQTAGTLREFAYPQSFGDLDSAMPRINVQETPFCPPLEMHETRHGVKEFGATADGVTDDSAAFQRAMNSGATEIVLEAGRYCLDSPVTIPATVRKISFSFCDLVAGPTLKSQSGQGAFVIAEDSDTPLFVTDIFTFEQWAGEHHMFDHNAKRTFCLADAHCQTLMMYRNSVPGSTVFFDNVATTTGVIPGRQDHERCNAYFKGQTVFARQFNPERGRPMMTNDGGTLVVLGYKSEDAGIVLHTLNGGKSEVLGGILNHGRDFGTAFVVEDSQLRLSTTSNGGCPEGYFKTVIRQVKDGAESVVESSTFPLRGFDEKKGPQFTVPFYCTD